MGKAALKELESQCNTLQNESDRLTGQLRRKEDELSKEKARKAEGSKKDDELRQGLLAQLQQMDMDHAKKMTELQEGFQRQASAVRSSRASFKDESQDWGAPDDEGGRGNPDTALQVALEPEPDALQAEAEKGASWRELHDREEQRALLAKAELQSFRTEMDELKKATDGEMQAASKAREELLEKQQAVDTLNEEKNVEIKETERQSEALQQTQDALEIEAKALQRQLSQAMYDVGKKDREQQLKEAELHEVRQSIHAIQDEMDEVNRQLQAQCGRVQKVESSLRLSRDLGSKVQSMREMLKESHGALSQLCGLVEHERTERGECSLGLRQQQMRTELLLQLLSHFKSRTQDLAPQVLLNQANEMMQGQAGMSSPAPAAQFSAEQAALATSVPPSAMYGTAGQYAGHQLYPA